MTATRTSRTGTDAPPAPARRSGADLAPGELRPHLRGTLHAAALLACVPAAAALLGVTRSGAERMAAWVYAASAFTLYLASSTYHIVTRRGLPRLVMRRVDHSAIYVLMAGSATVPVVVCAPPSWRTPLLVAVWVTAALGVVLRGVVPGRAHRLAHALYVAPGWALVVLVPAIARVSRTAVVLIMVGGVAYTVGAVLFFNNLPRWRSRWVGYHELWHLATVVGGSLVFAANYALLARA